jgi:hypothetical protein
MKMDRNQWKNPILILFLYFVTGNGTRVGIVGSVYGIGIVYSYMETNKYRQNTTETEVNGTLKPESRLFIEYITFYNQPAATPTQI